MPTVENVAAKEEPMTTPAPRFLPLETISVRLEGLNGQSERRKVFGLVSNMSETGACVITNLSVPQDTDVRLTIAGVRTDATIVAARVIWCAERLEPVKEVVGYLTGLTFDDDEASTIRTLLSSGIFQLVP